MVIMLWWVMCPALPAIPFGAITLSFFRPVTRKGPKASKGNTLSTVLLFNTVIFVNAIWVVVCRLFQRNV